ncbi:hypothetical protein CFHF_03340 [Caulobacter flavus]|uniref:Secreted protein n=1 Tax=Caulobacter flavus TaxID=1679497 RepID=A0A2N5CZ12_9CAUL|nr:hypothetical protein [Caulobacter flavus]AYV45262.1 hypothetical protein C1707_02830 [Caulobacter flavus]PLR19057.1 hypothetical protein CFHF_03340 [Caulobacter flavus]
MSVRRQLVAAAAVAGMISGAAPAAAQIPSNLRDLVGARAAGGESQLQDRGYALDHVDEGGSAKFGYWRRGDECVQVTTRDGRYLTIVEARGMCRKKSSGSDASAVVAGVAIVGLAAALAAHKKHHDDADRDHDAEYERGYQAALYGSDYDDRHESEGYHEGFLAGQSERDNRRFSNTRYVRNAPRSAQEACSRRADEFQNRPYGGSVPISARDLGRGDWELTMATGPYRSRCTVSSSGQVRAMEPY